MYNRVLFPLDGSKRAEGALELGRQLAGSGHTELHLFVAVNVGQVLFAERLERLPTDFEKLVQQQVEEAECYLAEVAARLQGEGVKVVTHVAQAEAREAIVDYAREANIELVVICSTTRQNWLQRLSGSIVDQVLRSAPCPVLVVRPPA